MNMMSKKFNVADIAEEKKWSVIPAGWYLADVTHAEEKTTKTGNGSYLALTLTVRDSSYESFRVYAKLHINNPNPEAEERGHRQLRRLMVAAGLQTLESTDELLGATLRVKVKMVYQPGWDPQKEACDFAPLDHAELQALAQAEMRSRPSIEEAHSEVELLNR